MKPFRNSPTLLFEGNKVHISWDAEQEYDYNKQRISQYRKTTGSADGCKHVSSITNPVARKSQGANEVGKLILYGITIGLHIANGLGVSMKRASLLQQRQEIDNQLMIKGNQTPSELQQKAEIDKMINEYREKSNKNFLLGIIKAASLFGASLNTLLKNSK